MKRWFCLLLVLFFQPGKVLASDSSLEVYGFVMLDSGYDTKHVHPDWFDTMRPTKLPSFDGEFGPNGNAFFGVRQTRLGVKTNTPTDLGNLKTQFEFEMFGTGVDAGQTTFRLRHAYGELGKFGAGQYWSPFMDIDVFPNSIEYWGPSGMAFFRNVQIRYMPLKGEYSRATIALERPGASADQGPYSDRIELSGVAPHFPLPDLSAEYRMGGSWGYIEGAGILRYIGWRDTNASDALDLDGSTTGWGLNLSSNLKFSGNVARLSVLYGEGVENYMNDAPADVGIQNNFSNSKTPILGKALPALGLMGFLDLNWSDKATSTIGYSRLDIDNTNGQSASSFKSGQYGVTNILFYPVKNVMFGPEFQWGYRDNKGGWHVPDYRIQFSAKYSFSFRAGS
jgi:hypothetical protein